jgi:hypothetical protein
MDPNPYFAPKAPPHAEVPSGDRCPKCGSTNVRAPKFTWWGGALGPRLFHHRVCDACRFTFNAKTGRSNKGPVFVYTGVGVAIGIAIGAGILHVAIVNAESNRQSVILAGVKRGCMKTCQAPVAQCETHCSCFVHELEGMDPKDARSLIESAASAKKLPPELEAARERCVSAQRR